MSYDLEWRIKRMLEIGNEILQAGRGGGRIHVAKHVAKPVIKIQNPRKQYYTDDWRWQEGLKCFDENKREKCNMLQKSLVKLP